MREIKRLPAESPAEPEEPRPVEPPGGRATWGYPSGGDKDEIAARPARRFSAFQYRHAPPGATSNFWRNLGSVSATLVADVFRGTLGIDPIQTDHETITGAVL